MKRVFAFLFAICLVVCSGCGKQVKKVNPYSSAIETVAEETEDNKSSKAKYEVSGGEDVFASFLEEDEEAAATVLVEKGTSVPTLETKWTSMNFTPVKGGSEDAAVAMRKKILNTGNTSDYYTWSGKTYYVSPDGNDDNDALSPQTAVKSLDSDAFVLNPPKSGDAVLFERGGLWRMTGSVKAREGVIYGSYGTGEKPTFYGSLANYADEKYWLASKKGNVWKLTIPDEDIGLIVFNNGELVGHKRLNGVTSLEKNGDYYFNYNDDTVYLYCNKGNPGKYYKDIEVCLKKSGIGIGKDNVVVDNLKIKYYGVFGITMCDNNNTKITNCEIGFIGGALQAGTTRYGNGIQQWNSTDKQLVENNWIYQAFDSGYTFQGNDNYETGINAAGEKRINDKVYYKDIVVKNNLIEYCTDGFEFWHQSKSGEPCLANIENFDCRDNLLRYNGYGWGGMQRKNFIGHAIYFGKHNFQNAKNCVITNNVFDLSSRALTYWVFAGDRLGDWKITNNTFYQANNTHMEAIWAGSVRYFSDQATLATAIESIFDPAPALVKWLQ